MATIVTTAEGMTPEWLNEVLAPVLGGATITEVTTKAVGTGQMGDSVRLTLTHDGGPEVPSSIVAKLPAADAQSRGTAKGTRSYEVEVSYYRDLEPTLDMRSPHCLYADHDLETDDFVLLLEDMAPAEQGDQLAGCSLEQAQLAVDELPGLHAPRWGDPKLAELGWLHRNPPEARQFTGMFIASVYPGFAERYAGRLDPAVSELCDAFIPVVQSYYAYRPEPHTVVHGDYRLDNLLFGTAESAAPIAVVDWQTVSLGSAVSDLSYFIGGGLVAEDRRAHERDLVDGYRRGMAERGVDLDADELWEQYRRFTFAGLIMAIAASMLVEQTDRGDEMFMAMANRGGQHAIDLDALSLFT